MINNLPTTGVTISNALHMVQTLRDDLRGTNSEQLVEQLMVCLQQIMLEQHQAMEGNHVFSPPIDSNDTIVSFHSSKIWRVAQKTDPNDQIYRLKATAIGRFYVNCLKQISLIRIISILAWRVLYPLYVRYITVYFAHRSCKQWHPLMKLADFIKANDITPIKLLEASQVATPMPKVFPPADQAYLSSPHDNYTFPPIYVAVIKNAVIHGGTNLVMTSDAVICHDLYNFECDYTSEELHGRHLIDVNKKRIRLLYYDEMPEHISTAASFVDACAANYAHWLTEVLPRIATFCAEDQFRNIPIVINAGLHPNIMESLFLVAGEDHEIILLPSDRAIQIDSLYVTSVAGYVPFERRNNKLSGHSHGLFNSYATDCMRKFIFNFTEKLPKKNWPEKIYLKRNSGVRKVINASELETHLIEQGFVVVEPEKLTFLQQAMLFSQAKSIIGASGASLANMIFTPSDACVQIFIGKYPNTSYWYWQNIACTSGNSVVYILGRTSENGNGIHSDFTIDLTDIPSTVGK